MRILIADDSIVSRHLLDATLRRWGYEVVIACDGNEAWRILQAEDAPKIAILDWMMPGMTGPEVCSRVRANVKDKDLYTYILLLSSKTAREELRDQATKDFLTSIWNRSSIPDILNRELQRGLREGRPVGLLPADLD